MSDDIPFDKSFDLAPDIVDQVAPGVRRVLANNPSPFTFKGTLSYIVGQGHVAIIDPGPLDEAHIAALLDAVRGETVTHIFVTHTHRDHSPAVPRIKAATGAVVLAEGPHRPARPLNIGEAPRLDASNDTEFQPDRALADGEVVTGRRLDHRGGHDARPHREPHGVRIEGGRSAVLRRSRDGVVDADRRAAGRRDERLHGLAAKARAALGADLPARPWRRGARGAALRAALHPPSPEPRGCRSCTGSARAKPISRPLYARSISVLDPRLVKAAGLSVLAHSRI